MIPAGIVLTGGSSEMEGLIELAEEVFHMPVRLGVPQGISGLVDVVKNPIHATGVGLLLSGQQQNVHSNSFEEKAITFQGLFSRMKSWFSAL